MALKTQSPKRREFSQATAQKKVSSVLNRVEKDARAVLYIDEEGHPTHTKVRGFGHYAMNCVAVIGPGNAYGYHFDHVLLLEVSIGHAKPYSQIKLSRTNGEKISHLHDVSGRRTVTARPKQSNLSEDQARTAISYIVDLLCELVLEQIRKRKVTEFERKIGTTGRNRRLIKFYPGVRVSVSEKDPEVLREFLLADKKIRLDSLRRRGRGLSKFLRETAREFSCESIMEELKILGKKDRKRLLGVIHDIQAYTKQYPVMPHNFSTFLGLLGNAHGERDLFEKIIIHLEATKRPLVDLEKVEKHDLLLKGRGPVGFDGADVAAMVILRGSGGGMSFEFVPHEIGRIEFDKD